MFFREDEAKIYENGVRQLRRTWRSAFNSVCLAVASDGVGCVCRVVIMPTCKTRWVRSYKLYGFYTNFWRKNWDRPFLKNAGGGFNRYTREFELKNLRNSIVQIGEYFYDCEEKLKSAWVKFSYIFASSSLRNISFLSTKCCRLVRQGEVT